MNSKNWFIVCGASIALWIMALGIQWVPGMKLTGFIFLVAEDSSLVYFASFKLFAVLLSLVLWSLAVYAFIRAIKLEK
jgi:hypothetical protein